MKLPSRERPWRRFLLSMLAGASISTLLGLRVGGPLGYLRMHGVANTAVLVVLGGIPLACVLICWRELLGYFTRRRSRRLQKLPSSTETIETNDGHPVAESHGSAASERGRDRRIAKQPSWFHTRWIGPGGYR